MTLRARTRALALASLLTALLALASATACDRKITAPAVTPCVPDTIWSTDHQHVLAVSPCPTPTTVIPRLK